MRKTKNNTNGFMIIEVLLAIVILSVLFLSLFSMMSFLATRTERSKFDAQAAALMQEGIEVSRNTMIANWAGFPAGSYYPLFDADLGRWVLKPGQEGLLQGRFERVLTVSNVCRGAVEGLQVDCPAGQLDSQSKRVTVTIKWKEASTDKSVEAKLLIYHSKSS